MTTTNTTMTTPMMLADEIAFPVLKSVRFCHNGRCYSDDYDWKCSGCASCPRETLAARAVSTFVFGIANGARHAELECGVRAAMALSTIGAAVRAALAPGLAITMFFADVVSAWNTVAKGRMYRVTGKRGKAKEHYGKVGVCTWIGESTWSAPRQYRTASWNRPPSSTTLRAGLKIEGEEKPVYVPASALEPVVDTQLHARIAAKAERERCAAATKVRPSAAVRGATVLVIAREHAGLVGKVFWVGADKKGSGLRIGVKFCACKRRCECKTAWVGEHEAVPPPTHAETYEQAEAVMIALAECGLDGGEYGTGYEARMRQLAEVERS